jgi:hypothetical protein
VRQERRLRPEWLGTTEVALKDERWTALAEGVTAFSIRAGKRRAKGRFVVPWKSLFYVRRLKRIGSLRYLCTNQSRLYGRAAYEHRHVRTRELEFLACHSIQGQGIIVLDITLRIL